MLGHPFILSAMDGGGPVARWSQADGRELTWRRHWCLLTSSLWITGSSLDALSSFSVFARSRLWCRESQNGVRLKPPTSLCSQCATIHVCCYLNHCLESSVPRHVTSPSLSQPCFLVCYIVKRSQQNTKNIQSAVVYCCLPYYWAKAHILHEKNLTAHTKKKQKVKRKWKVYVPYWNKDEHDSICSLMYWIRVQCYLI